jgi:hypothetical protein
MALRQGWYLGKAHDTLASGTIKNTISDISSTFQEAGQPNPTKVNDLQLSFILQQQFGAFKNTNPKEKQQKAIPACIITEIAKRKLTELQCATSQLTILAFFFAMRSYKYVKVPQQEKCRTEILRLRNLWFFNSGRLVHHDDPNLEYSNCLNITFKMQKKDEKNNTTTQMASGISSSHRPLDPIVPGSQQRHPNLCHLEIRPRWTYHVQANLERVARCRLGNWGGRIPHCQERDWNTLHPLGSSNGHVPWQLPRLPHHDDRTLVKRRIPTLYP